MHSCHFCLPFITVSHAVYILTKDTNSFFPLARAEFDDSLPFSRASYIPISPHLAIYFLVYLSVFLFPDSYVIHQYVA